MKANDAIARLPLRDAFAHGDDGAGCFVSENLRRRDETVLNFFDVGAADAAGRDANQNFSRGNFRHRNRLNHDAPRAAIHGRAHSGVSEIDGRGARIGCGYGFGHVVASNSDFVLL